MAKKQHNSGQGTFASLEGEKVMPEGFYTGDQPNPHLRRFLDAHATPYNPESDEYAVRAFSQAITTTKATAIYNMHSYHQGKKPHDAIRQFVRFGVKRCGVLLDELPQIGIRLIARVEPFRHRRRSVLRIEELLPRVEFI